MKSPSFQWPSSAFSMWAFARLLTDSNSRSLGEMGKSNQINLQPYESNEQPPGNWLTLFVDEHNGYPQKEPIHSQISQESQCPPLTY